MIPILCLVPSLHTWVEVAVSSTVSDYFCGAHLSISLLIFFLLPFLLPLPPFFLLLELASVRSAACLPAGHRWPPRHASPPNTTPPPPRASPASRCVPPPAHRGSAPPGAAHRRLPPAPTPSRPRQARRRRPFRHRRLGGAASCPRAAPSLPGYSRLDGAPAPA